MKKSIIILLACLCPVFAHAQDGLYAPEIFRVVAMIFTVGLFMWFILAIMKRLMDNKLKNKIVDKGVPDSVVASVLKTNPKEDLNANVKWFAIFAGLGIALTAIHYTLPLGIHSLAIMAFSIAASFLGYFLFLKQSEKNTD